MSHHSGDLLDDGTIEDPYSRAEMGKSCTPAYKIFLYAPRSVQLVRAMENVTYGSFEHTKIVSFDNSWSEIPNLKLS